MNTSKTRSSRRSQRRFSVYKQETATEQRKQKIKQEELLQQQELPHEQEEDQEYQDEEQNQEQVHIKQEIKQENDVDHDHVQEQEQINDPQLMTEPIPAVEKVTKHTQTRKEQNFWYWIPRRTDDSPWECLVKGKGQKILEAVFNSKSTSHNEKVSNQGRSTMQTTETEEHRTYARTTLSQFRTHCSNPAQGSRPIGMQSRCQNSAISGGCSNYAPGTRNCQRGIPRERIPVPQMFPPSCIRAMHPSRCSIFGLSAPVQNSVQPAPNANVMQPPSVEAGINEGLATLLEFTAGILKLHEERPDLQLGQIRERIRGTFQQMSAESGQRPQQ